MVATPRHRPAAPRANVILCNIKSLSSCKSNTPKSPRWAIADNQDRAAVVVADDAAMMLVFDGMGGHSDGARAAETGLKVVQDMFMDEAADLRSAGLSLHGAVAAHDEVVGLGKDRRRRFPPARDLRDLSRAGRRCVLGAHRRQPHLSCSRWSAADALARSQSRRSADPGRRDHRGRGCSIIRCATSSNAASAATRRCPT